MRQQGQQVDTSQSQKQGRKPLFWVRLVTFIIALLLILVAAVIWILNSLGSQTNLFTTIFAALGVIFALFQLFPLFFPSKESQQLSTPAPPPQFPPINVQVQVPLPQIALPSQSSNSSTTQQQKSALLHRYLHSVISKNQGLNLSGIYQSQALLCVNVPLDDIFIHIHAVSDRPVFDTGIEHKKLLEEIKQLRQRTDLDPNDREDYIQSLRAAIWHSQMGEELLKERRGKNIAIEDVLHGLTAEKPVAVILGSPGSGKSTTMRWLALHMAHATCKPDYQLPEGLSPAQIPILITIGDYAKALGTTSTPSQREVTFKDFLWSELTRINRDLPSLIEEELARGRCLLLFDGLDEVANDMLRRRVTKDIFEFITNYPTGQDTPREFNRVIITSRIVGYEPGPFAQYAQYTLQDLEDTQIRQFLTNWCPAVERHQAKSVQEMRDLTPQQELDAQTAGYSQRDRLLEALEHSPGIKRLAVNPLMLTILALIQKSGRTLPHRRIELYKTVTLTLLDNWNQLKGGKMFSHDEIDLAEDLLSEFAYQLHSTDLPLTERDVTRITRETMAAFYRRPKEQIQSDDIKCFIETLRSSSSLFVERGQGLFGFMHRTFQEYYIALYLADKKHHTDQSLKTFVAEKCHTAIWREPFLLVIAYKSEQKDRDERQQANALIQIILDTHDAFDTLLHRNLLFAASSIVDCNAWHIDEALQTTIANQLFDLYGDAPSTGRFTELQEDIEQMALLWLRGQPQGSNLQPPLLETWHTALCAATNPVRQEGAAHLLAAIAPDLPTCPKTILPALIPPLLQLAGVVDIAYPPPDIRSHLPEPAVQPSSPGIEDYALVALRLLDAAGPAGWLHKEWLKWSEEQPELLERLTQHSLELDYLLTPAAVPGKRDDQNWDAQIKIDQEWKQLAQRDLHDLQLQLLQASNTARFPHAYLFKQMLATELADQSWRITWDSILQREMALGRSATYQACLDLRLLLHKNNHQQHQKIADELMAAIVTQAQQTQAIITITNIYMRYLRDLRNLTDLRYLRDLIGLGYLRDLTDLLDLRNLRDLRNRRDLLDLRNRRDLLDLLDLIDLRDLRGLRYLLDLLDLRDLMDKDRIVGILCNILKQKGSTSTSAALLALYSVLTHYESIHKSIPRQVRLQVQQHLLSRQAQPPTIEQRQLIEVISRQIGIHATPTGSTARPALQGTPDQLATALYALRQNPQLAKQDVQRILATCTDARGLSEEKRKEVENAYTVHAVTWNLLEQQFNLAADAQLVVVQDLDHEDALVCAAAALLVKNSSKTLPRSVRKEAADKIVEIFKDEKSSRRPLDTPLYNIWRLDDVLFETLGALAE